MSRPLLNCWLVALHLWIISLFSKARRYLFFRQSYSFSGMILHAGVAQGVDWKTLTIVEFVPTKPEFGTLRNFMLLFRGRYRVWELRAVKSRRFDSLDDALAFANFERKV